MKVFTKKCQLRKKYPIFAVLLILTVFTLCACMRADNGQPTANAVSGEGTDTQNANTDNAGAGTLTDNGNGTENAGTVTDNGNGTGDASGTGGDQPAGGSGNDNANSPDSTPENGSNGEENSQTGDRNGDGNAENGNENGDGNAENGNISGDGNTENGNDNGDGTAMNNTADSGENTPEDVKHIVVLDPGHGGKRGGAWYLGLAEKDLTLKVAQFARDYLLENYENIEVYLTREKDEALDPDNKIELEMRCDLARQVGADCLVSIHFNATDAHIQHGAEIWISRNKEIHDATLALGESIMAELEALGIRRNSIASRKSTDMFDENGIAIDYYAINRHCAARGIPGIIVEQCYMDNEADQIHIKTDEALKELGEANARGIANYLELKPKM